MDYSNRLVKLSATLSLNSADGLIIDDPIDLLYLTGLDLSAGKLLLTSQSALLVVDGRYLEVCQQRSPCPVQKLEENFFQNWIQSTGVVNLAFDSNKTSYLAFTNLEKNLAEMNVTLLPIDSPVQHLRLIKDSDEIKLLKQAARLNVEGYLWLTQNLTEGISERELALELEFFWKRKGATKLSFDSIIAFGANGSMPHYRAGETRLEEGMAVLIDIGVTWQHYQSDLTRVNFYGTPAPILKTIYQIVEEAKQKATAACLPGTPIGELDRIARQHIKDQGYGEYFTHSLGHGIGLETHEVPILRSKGPWTDQLLKPGMVITIEPGIYLPKVGGVRLEDTLLITETGHEILTKIIE